ncbi:Uma2 family endonuclease [Kitasatospora sp. NPDC059571]|uniref:Uma2 family endonuclease n=1 Tax=Kitasatospora sp. NPDC059571 TaxID=3346871 RepID=UPI0036CDB1BF
MDYKRIRAIADELAKVMPDEAKGLEIGADQIVMMMSPSRAHDLLAFKIRHQLEQQIPPALAALTAGDIEDPVLGRLRRPDVLVVDFEAFEEDTMEPLHPADVRLVAEIVSPSNRTSDYIDKMRDYPAMGIPAYLLVDPNNGRIQVHTEPGTSPDGPQYHRRYDHTFGDPVPILDWTITTTDFRRYPNAK